MKMDRLEIVLFVVASVVAPLNLASSRHAWRGLRVAHTESHQGVLKIASRRKEEAQRSASAAPSCDIFAEMLGRVYYMRDQLEKTTASLSSLGYQTGQEWFVDQDIGNVTPGTMEDVVCPLLANSSQPLSLLSLRAQSTQSLLSRTRAFPEFPNILDKLPSVLGGGDDSEKPAANVTPAEKTAPAPAEGAAQEEQAVAEPEGAAAQVGATTGTDANTTAADTSDGSAGANATVSQVGGCPAGSWQKKLVTELNHGFDGIRKDGKSLSSVKGIFEELMLSLERSVNALYTYRECPAATHDEFKTRHVCNMHRDQQAVALGMQQRDVPEMKARLFALQSQIKDIDEGKSHECFQKRDDKRRQQAPRPQAAEQAERRQKRQWCLKVHALTDALLDGRRSQKQWLKSLGNTMQRLGTMSLQLQRLISDPVLRRDKIPTNALKALTKSWKHMESPMQQLRMMGSLRAKEATNVDSLVLELSGLLRRVSNDAGCSFEGFRMRYSSRTCKSLKSELVRAEQARQTDLDGLEHNARQLMLEASDGLIENKCTAAPTTAGCWLRLPTGCPNLPSWKGSNLWSKDVFGEQSLGAGENSVVCLGSRKIQMDNLCGVSNTEMKHIPL